jgi:hypothetical protein
MSGFDLDHIDSPYDVLTIVMTTNEDLDRDKETKVLLCQRYRCIFDVYV